MIEAMFNEDSQNLANRLKKAVPGRERISGTSNSPKSTEVFEDQHVDDFNNEVFDSGDELYHVQWDSINKDYNKSMRQNDEGFTNSEIDDDIEKDLNDDTLVENLKRSKKVKNERVLYQLEPSQVIRSKHRVAVETELILQPGPTEANSPGVLSNSNELEEDELFLDSQYLTYNEDTVCREEGNSDATEEDNEYEEEFDAQSLGINSEADQYDEDDEALSEDQIDAKRNTGK